MLLAQVPQTARVNRRRLQAPAVIYQAIRDAADPGTSVSRAVNTDKDIIKVGDLYYMCFQGVWFMGRSRTGPGRSPVRSRRVTVRGRRRTTSPTSPSSRTTTTEWVTFAAVAGYSGMMVAWGCAVGTGWYYPP